MATLREDLEAQAATLADSSTDAAPVDSTSTEAAPTEVQAAPETTTEAPQTQETTATTGGRDAAGRFVSKTTAGKTPGQAAPSVPPTESGVASSTNPPTAAAPAQTEPPKPGDADATRPPSSWRHEAREAWAKAPPEIQKEVARRETEVARMVTEFHPVRQFAQEMHRAVAPIAERAKASGVPVHQIVSNYVEFDRTLASGDPEAQAAAVARLIKGYNIPVEALADAIDRPTRQAPVNPEQMRAQIRQEMERDFQRQHLQQQARQHQELVKSFASKPDADLMNDEIRHVMADLIEAAGRRDVELSLEDAYNQAIWANPRTRAIIQQRQEAKTRETAQAATQRAMIAGSSVKSRPSSPISGNGEGRSIREDLEAALAEASGR